MNRLDYFWIELDGFVEIFVNPMKYTKKMTRKRFFFFFCNFDQHNSFGGKKD